MKATWTFLILLGISALPHAAHGSAEEVYPTKPIRLVVGFPAGGGADNTARLYGNALAREFGQPVIIDNKPGAGTTIAADMVAKAPADGYTLYLGTASVMGSDKILFRNIKYQPKDFAPITRLVAAPMILVVNKSTSIKSVAELVARARAQPGKLNYSSSGNGVFTHVAGLYFSRRAGVPMTHVPYKGGAQSAQAVAAGDVELTFGTAPSVRPMIDAGKVVALAVTSAARSPANPQLPTIAESGLQGYDMSAWYGLFAPAATPPEVIQKLFTASRKVMSDAGLQKKFINQGDEVSVSESPAEFQRFAEREGKLAADLLVAYGAKVD
jgi:tripartite-type tricarboxylate transporter receptor subunit TctC